MGIALLAPILFLAVVEGQVPNSNLDPPPGAQRYYSGDGGYENKCKITNCDTSRCQHGQFLSGCGEKNAGSCSACINVKPPNSIWTGNGQYNATGCTWACAANYKKVGDNCILQTCAEQGQAAVAYSDFLPGPEGAGTSCKFQCNPGYHGTTPAGKRGPESCNPCNPGTFANTAGLTACSNCGPGLFSSNQGSTACSTCVALDRKYSTGPQNQVCTDCTTCGIGFYRTNCGGSQGPGDCTACTNTNWS
jgi:hypothetical protein